MKSRVSLLQWLSQSRSGRLERENLTESTADNSDNKKQLAAAGSELKQSKTKQSKHRPFSVLGKRMKCSHTW